ncbi:MAG: cellulase N-terminal Ig-like domain-containing protein, partial [bacterium]
MTLLALLIAAAVSAAGERVTPIALDLKPPALEDGYAFTDTPGAVELDHGRVPVVQWQGRAAIKVAHPKQAGGWHVGIARPGWVRFYLDDYPPDGVLEFDGCGAQGGEPLTIGPVSVTWTASGRDVATTGAVPIARYGGLKKEWKRFRIPVSDFARAAPGLNLGNLIKLVVSAEPGASPFTAYLAGLSFRTTSPERVQPPIRMDQTGYRPQDAKIAKLAVAATAFRIVDASTGRTVFSGVPVLNKRDDPVSGDTVWDADFTKVQAAGRYRLETDGAGSTSAFSISADVYAPLFRDAMRFYFLQRCGMTLDAAHAGAWARAPCHQADAKAVERDGSGEPRDVRGGWHDAGDTNKYPPFVRDPLCMMLDLYDARPAAFPDCQLGIAES